MNNNKTLQVVSSAGTNSIDLAVKIAKPNATRPEVDAIYFALLKERVQKVNGHIITRNPYGCLDKYTVLVTKC